MAENEWFEKAWECMDNEDYAQAREYLEKALEEGEIEAYCDLGNLYFEGKGVEQDYKRAFDYYQKGAKAGEPYCMDNLGMCYFWGHGVDTDIQKSAFYTEKAAKSGVERAMYDTGLNYERGYGVSQNIDKALYWLEKAAIEDNTAALMELGNLYYTGEYVEKDLEKAFDYYKKGVELDDGRSKFCLSTFYEKGLVVEKDIEKAKNLCQEAYDWYYELAVTEDSDEAQFRMGCIYDSGLPLIGIDQDYSQAAEWYEKAAENGMDAAQNNLGLMYTHGVGVGQNYEKAFYWFSRAAEKMNLEAISNLGNCYYWGRGIEQDYSKAAEYHSKAAHLGYANSQEVLGELYFDGKGVEQNYTQAAHWFKESCENGERSAFGPLGDCYSDGLGVEKDEKMAYKLYQTGAEMGDLQSKVSLAKCLIEGWGTSSDCKKASQILESVCNDEEVYREKLVTMTSREDETGRVFWEDPLDEYNLKYYAKAYYLLGTLCYAGNGTDGSSPSKAIAYLRMADRLGYEGDGMPPEELIIKIVEETEKADVQDATDCYVEVREENDRGEHYKVVIHHADDTESVVNFKGRNKFIYMLALLIAHEGKSVYGLTTTHFSYMRENLAEMAKTTCINADSYINWIDEFLYAEKEEAYDHREEKNDETIGLCSLWPYRYSNAFSGANRAIKACCVSDDEFETFKLRSTSGKNAVTTMALDYSQIELPDSLAAYLDCLPTQKEIAGHKPPQSRKLPITVRE